MSDRPRDISSEQPEASSLSDHQQALAELRNLLLAPEQHKLDHLTERLDNPALHAQELGQVLPEAIKLRSSQDSKLTESLAPIIEESFATSAQKSPQVIVDIIAPVMGPAIRQAITNALRTMVQSLNQIVEHTFTAQGLKWRLEAARTGKPFAEVVLLHTLNYRVEQVFLIHRETGLLLYHVALDAVAVQDEAMVSGMLSAIESFVRDSFGGDSDKALDYLQVGELSVWIEQGPAAILACVIRGTPPPELRNRFQDILDTLHREHHALMGSFQGDTGPFEAVRPILEGCLQAQYKKAEQKTSPALVIVPAVVVIALLVWGYLAVREQQRWETYLNSLRAQPGILVTTAEKRDGEYLVAGFRDPLATDPAAFISQAGLDPESVRNRWEPYYALSPEFLLTRATAVLRPPESVHLEFREGKLLVTGSASPEWIGTARSRAPTIPGLNEYPLEWDVAVDYGPLGPPKREVEAHRVPFVAGSMHLSGEGRAVVQAVSASLRKLEDTARAEGMNAHVEIVGHAPVNASTRTNRILKEARARAVWAALTTEDFPTVSFSATGAASSASPSAASQPVPGGLELGVSFRLLLSQSIDTTTPSR